VGRLDDNADWERIVELSADVPAQLGVIEEADEKGADLTAEEEVLLGEPQHDQSRVAWLVRRVALNADHVEHDLWSGQNASGRSSGRRTGVRVMTHSLRSRLSLLGKEQFDVNGNAVVCWFGAKGGSRRHTVRVIDCEDTIRLEATVVGPSTLEQLHSDHRMATWRRNRLTSLVAFRIDGRGRLLAEAAVPKVGLTPEEFKIYLRAIASEADRLELVFTGQDVQ